VFANPREMGHQYRLGARLHQRGEPDGHRPVEVILTRDRWMHRVDITRATGREMLLSR
jgi:hypothetical protein